MSQDENNKNSKKKKKSGFKLHHLLLLISLLGFVLAGAMLLPYLLEGRRQQDIIDDLVKKVEEAAPEEETARFPTKRYETAYNQNQDYVAWLTIPGTIIDYPVMHTPDDPQYYLKRAFDKSDASGGTLFVGENCDVNSTSLIIYGHNMKNDTMFGTLDEYKNKEFWEEHKTFQLEKRDELAEYEVIYAVYTNIPNIAGGAIPYYAFVGNLAEVSYGDILNWFEQNKLYDTGLKAEYNDQIVMLSTCSYQVQDGRFVILGRKINKS